MPATHASDWDRDAALTTARILLEIKAVNFRPEEPYTFTSGWKSPVYIDCRKIISFPRARNRICDLGVEKIGRHVGFETIESVVGGETAGIPFAAWIADRMLAPMAYVRKQPKGFGRNAQIEGEVPVGKRTLLVEDLTTDGASKIRFANALREAGAICDHTFVVFYYGVFPGSFEQMKAMGLNLHHLCTWWDVLEVCRERPYFSEDALKAVREFLGDSGRLVEGAWRDRQPGRGAAEGRGVGGQAMDGPIDPTELKLQLPAAIHDALADIARGQGRSPQSVALDAIAAHCAAALELRASILRGEADFAAGRVVDHEDVIAGLRSIVETARKNRQT